MYYKKNQYKSNIGIKLIKYPESIPTPSCFSFENCIFPIMEENCVLIRNKFFSVDPYLRLKMHLKPPTYIKRFKITEIIRGYAIAQIVQSEDEKFPQGCFVTGIIPWQKFVCMPTSSLKLIEAEDENELISYLHVLGMPGMSAYFGILKIGKPLPNETLFISSAAGAVGNLVGQIGKIYGCRVVGSVGSDEKQRYLIKNLGFNAVFNYKKYESLFPILKSLCPNGIDINFENVGGTIFENVLPLITKQGRIVLCGLISQYNSQKPNQSPSNLSIIKDNKVRLTGFLVSQFNSQRDEFYCQMKSWLKAGEIKFQINLISGFEKIPKVFELLFSGNFREKLIIKI